MKLFSAFLRAAEDLIPFSPLAMSYTEPFQQGSPRGGWPILPYSKSKYAPHQGAAEKARRRAKL